MSQESRPYQEVKTFDHIYRKFTQDIDEEELVWHRDRKDREVQIIGETDWLFQLEDKIPQQLKNTIFIPKDTYHRLIKGTGELNIHIIEF
jgi:predicted nucleotidyltransferase